MNCKPGDLAIVVRSETGKSVGKILRVLRRSHHDGLRNGDGSIEHGVVWVTDKESVASFGDVHSYWLDSDLRPLRDNDGEDEMIRIAGKPERDLLKECDSLIRQFNDLAEQAKGLR